MWTALEGDVTLSAVTLSSQAIPNSQSIPSNGETKSFGPEAGDPGGVSEQPLYCQSQFVFDFLLLATNQRHPH